MNRADDLATLTEAKPFVRGILAFLIYLRFGLGHEVAYPIADGFIEQLERDLVQ